MTSCPAPVLVDAADPPDAAELVDPDYGPASHLSSAERTHLEYS